MTKLIAEVCQNHLGSRELLGRMIAEAAGAGAGYVKMQSIFSEDLTDRARFEEGETNADGTPKAIKRPSAAEKARLQKLNLTEDDHRFFIQECVKHGVVPFTTIFARSRIPEIAALPWPERIIKVASYDCASEPLLRELCERFDHLIISTGASYDEEIAKAAEIVKNAGKKLTFLHCVTSYPNSLSTCHLARMQWLRQFTPSVGWSDHTLVERDKLKAAKAAIVLGAEWIERHFTILEKDETKDGPVSIRPPQIRELAEFDALPPTERERIAHAEVPDWNEILGDEHRQMTPVELLNRDYYRGRFASKKDGEWVYNWEEKPAF